MASATGSIEPVSQTGRTPQRVFAIWIAILALVGVVGVTAILAIGGRPDPAALRAVAPLLGGEWRFHLGDDPRWASANVDDSGWETVNLGAPASSHDGDVGLPNYVGGWMVHGHPGYQGYAWYRRSVTVPAGNRAWDMLGPPLVEDGYELYWNGVRLGGSGRLGASPRMVGTRPLIFALPADAAGTTGVLAIRAFMHQVTMPPPIAAVSMSRRRWRRVRRVASSIAWNGGALSPVTSSNSSSPSPCLRSSVWRLRSGGAAAIRISSHGYALRSRFLRRSVSTTQSSRGPI